MGQLAGPTDPTADARWDAHPAAQGILHRHLDLHRLQGLRGGLQGVEPQPAATVTWTAGVLLRQHRRAGRQHLAACRLHRAGPGTHRRGAGVRPRPGQPGHARRRPSRTGCGPRRRTWRRRIRRPPDTPEFRWLMSSRRLQALHARRLPGRLPDRRAVPHRVRHRGGAGRRVQRLRNLRRGLPVRRRSSAAATARHGRRQQRGAARRAARRPQRRRRPEVHAVLRPARRRRDAGLRQDLPDDVDQVRRPRRHGGHGPGAGRRAARAGADRGAGSTAPTNTTASAAPDRSSCCSTSPRCTGSRRTRGCPRPTCRGCTGGPASPWPAWSPPPRWLSWEDAGDPSEFDSFRPPEPARRRRRAASAARGRRGDAATARAKCRWFRSRNSPPTTADRWSSRRPGATTSPPTCSSAASRRLRSAWPPAGS